MTRGVEKSRDKLLTPTAPTGTRAQGGVHVQPAFAEMLDRPIFSLPTLKFKVDFIVACGVGKWCEIPRRRVVNTDGFVSTSVLP